MELSELFSPHVLNEVGMFARIFCAAVAIQLLLNFAQQYRYFMTGPSKLYGNRVRLLGLVPVPVLNGYQFLSIGVCLIFCLLLASFGIYARLAVLVSLISWFFYFGQIMSLAYVQRKANLIPIVLLILLVSPSLSESLSSQSTHWELVLIKLALIQVYLSAAMEKLRQSGAKWINGKFLRAYLLENYLWADRPAALTLARNLKACAIVSSLVLIFELTFGIVLFLPALTFVYVAFAFVFHLGTLITMRINYLKYIWPVYLVFFIDMAFHFKTILGL
jgi:hypothetical protein